MQLFSRSLALTLALVSFASVGGGCSQLKFPFVYRINVQQGNIIDQKKLDQLKIGMSKRQVQFLLGTPLLVDTFNTERWDYLYSVRRGDKVLGEKRFTVFFASDALARYEGDVGPGKSAIEDAKLDERIPTPQEQAEINAQSKTGSKKPK
jgi:outer membrane protein assembly factor BamE